MPLTVNCGNPILSRGWRAFTGRVRQVGQVGRVGQVGPGWAGRSAATGRSRKCARRQLRSAGPTRSRSLVPRFVGFVCDPAPVRGPQRQGHAPDDSASVRRRRLEHQRKAPLRGRHGRTSTGPRDLSLCAEDFSNQVRTRHQVGVAAVVLLEHFAFVPSASNSSRWLGSNGTMKSLRPFSISTGTRTRGARSKHRSPAADSGLAHPTRARAP